MSGTWGNGNETPNSLTLPLLRTLPLAAACDLIAVEAFLLNQCQRKLVYLSEGGLTMTKEDLTLPLRRARFGRRVRFT